MATTIFCLFNLKPGVTEADYEAWAKSTDIPTVRSLKSIDHFAVFQTSALLGSDAKPPYRYVEIIVVNDMDTFGGEVSTETMQKVAGQFQGFADSPMFILSNSIEGK
jgi:hypothetical protein